MITLIEKLRLAVGDEHVTTDALECKYYAQDVYSRSYSAAAVVSPGDKNELDFHYIFLLRYQ